MSLFKAESKKAKVTEKTPTVATRKENLELTPVNSNSKENAEGIDSNGDESLVTLPP